MLPSSQLERLVSIVQTIQVATDGLSEFITPADSDFEVVALPDVLSSPSAPAVKAKAKAKPKAKASSDGKYWYCVTSGPEDVVGFYHTTWAELQPRLPTGAYIGSGTHLKKFNTESEAATYWQSKGWLLPAPRRI